MSEFERAEQKGVRVSECLNFEDFVMSRLKVLWICFYSADFESYKLDFYVAPRGNFVQLRVAQKH